MNGKRILVTVLSLTIVQALQGFINENRLSARPALTRRDIADAALAAALRSAGPGRLVGARNALEEHANVERPITGCLIGGVLPSPAPLTPIEVALKGNEQLLAALLLRHGASLSGKQIADLVINRSHGINVDLLRKLIALASIEKTAV